MSTGQTQPSLEPLPPGSPGTEQFWMDLDRAYAVDMRHAERISRLNNTNNVNNHLLFQSGLMSIMLAGEGEAGLIQHRLGPDEAGPEVPSPNPLPASRSSS